jgi:hypothetical protein
MKEKDNLIRVYTGNEVLVFILKDKLEETGISTTIQNDSHDNFLRGVPTAIDLYIQQFDLKKAEPVISEFIKKNKG